jgi:hydrogenase maturation protein HypF
LEGLDLKDSYDFEVVRRIAEEIGSVGDRGVSEVFIVDWRGIISGALTDIRNDVSQGEISIKFHNTLIEIAVEMAKKVKLQKVVLSGGCFQNKYLTEHLIGRLREEGFSSYWHQLVPPNDGGISLGQAVVGMCRARKLNNKLE